MKMYYIIYENVGPNPGMVRFLCIVENKEVAQDFCNKHFECDYVEEVIGERVEEEK